MEQQPKRQRISRIIGRSSTENLQSGNSATMGSTGVDKGDTDENHTDLEDSLSSGAYGDSSPFIQAAEGIREAPSGPPGGDTALWARHRRLHQRQIVPNPAPTPLQAVKTVVESVVQIVVENGQSSVGAFMLPTVPTVISFPSYGQLTVPIVPAYPSSPPQTLPTVPAYPFTSAVAAITGAATEMPPPSNTAIPVPGIGPEGSSAVRGANSSDTTSSTMHMPTSSTLLMTSSSSSVQSSTPIPSRASSVPNFPFLTTGGNFSRTTSSSFDGSTSFTSTSTLNLVSNSTSFTSTASGTSSSLGILVTSSSTTSLEPTSTTKASTSATDPSTSGENASGAVVGAGGIGTATGSGGPSSPTAGNGSSNSDSTAPPTQTVVGGVVGGVAGLAILVVLMLFLLRWHRRRQRTIQASAGDDSEVAPPGTAQSGAMTQRSSNVPLAAAAIAPGFFKRLRPHSGMTTATTETAPSERGFQNLGGRKLPSVLAAGGDGYGGGYDKETLSGSSFYRDSQGLHGGPGSPSASGFAGPSAGPLDHGARKVVDAGDKEVAIMRPSPARTPVTSQGAFEVLPSPTRGPTIPRATPTPPPPIGIITRDAIGRSRPSFNGSRGSRFTEETA